jgi:hypothetical protein
MPNDVANAFLTESREQLREGMHKIEHCIAQLSDAQLWYRPRPEMNSIANLMLHLSGNMRQWLVAGVGGAKDIRNRPLEFSDNTHRPKSEILALLLKTVTEADATLSHQNADQLLQKRRIQGFDTTVIGAIMHTIPHFRGHVQEIIHMTRQQLGEKYQFDFVPKGKEQESAGGAA